MKTTWYRVLYNILPFFPPNITFQQEFLFCLWNAFKTTYWWSAERKYLRIFCKKSGSWQQLGKKTGRRDPSPLGCDCDPRMWTSKSTSLSRVPFPHLWNARSVIRSLWRSCQMCSARISYGEVNLSHPSPMTVWTYCTMCLSGHLHLRDRETQARAFWVFQEQSQHFPAFFSLRLWASGPGCVWGVDVCGLFCVWGDDFTCSEKSPKRLNDKNNQIQRAGGRSLSRDYTLFLFGPFEPRTLLAKRALAKYLLKTSKERMTEEPARFLPGGD